MDSYPPQPLPTITAGLVGAVSGDNVDVLHRLSELLEEIRLQPQRNGPKTKVRLRVLSGPEQHCNTLNDWAVIQTDVALDVIVPVSINECRAGTASEPLLDPWDALLSKADSVIVLDGKPSVNNPAHHMAELTMLNNIDVLLTVGDPDPNQIYGLTKDLLEEAFRRDIPVIAVSTEAPKLELIVRPKNSLGTRKFADVIPKLIEPSLASTGLITNLALNDEPQWLSRPRPTGTRWAYAAYPILLWLVGVSKKRSKGPTEPPPPPASILHEAFDWWDREANLAAQAFRSAVIVNFVLAALAVLLAAFSALVSEAKWLFVLAEVVTIALLLVNTWLAERRQWHSRWLESREVAELLRVSILLRQVGIGRGVVASDSSNWSRRYVCALERSTPPLSIDQSNIETIAAGIEAEIESQSAWNKASAHRMHTAGHRIEKFGEILFIAVLGLAVGWLILWLANPYAAKSLKYWLTAFTAGLPAVATASYGIRIILDFEGIAGRAHRLGQTLHEALSQWRTTEPSAAALQAFINQATHTMLIDVNAWRLLAEGRKLAVPG